MVEAILQHLINNFSYLGVFISSIIASASVLFPLPGQLIIVLAAVLNLNPFLTAAVASTGSMTGEMTGYGIGVLGGKAMKGKFKKYKKLVAPLRKYFRKYTFWVIFVTAFLIFPFDLVGMISGAYRYDIKLFWLAGFLGKFLKTLVLFILFQNGIHIFGNIINLFGL